MSFESLENNSSQRIPCQVSSFYIMLSSRALHYIVEFSYQSQRIGFSEWINFLTLCLTPLLTQILAGAPDPIITGKTHPHWTDRIGHYNPTSIVWRYLAISDRRVRTIKWGPDDMVAVNLVLWKESGWYNPIALQRLNGPDNCSNISSKPRVPLLSMSTFKTLLVALQGAQALYLSIGAQFGASYPLSLATIFFPISILGLLRLPAAPWLLDKSGYCYSSVDTIPSTPEATSRCTCEETGEAINQCPRTLPQCSIPALLVRSFFLLNLAGLFGIACIQFSPLRFRWSTLWISATRLVNIVFFAFLTGVTMMVVFAYVLSGKTNSTIIPCLSSVWYKCYTFLLVLFSLAMIVLSALETIKHKGEYIV